MSVHLHLRTFAYFIWENCFRMMKPCQVGRRNFFNFFFYVWKVSVRCMVFYRLLILCLSNLLNRAFYLPRGPGIWFVFFCSKLDLKLPVSSANSPVATIMHLSIRPYALPGQGDSMKKKKRRGRSGELCHSGFNTIFGWPNPWSSLLFRHYRK